MAGRNRRRVQRTPKSRFHARDRWIKLTALAAGITALTTLIWFGSTIIPERRAELAWAMDEFTLAAKSSQSNPKLCVLRITNDSAIDARNVLVERLAPDRQGRIRINGSRAELEDETSKEESKLLISFIGAGATVSVYWEALSCPKENYFVPQITSKSDSLKITKVSGS